MCQSFHAGRHATSGLFKKSHFSSSFSATSSEAIPNRSYTMRLIPLLAATALAATLSLTCSPAVSARQTQPSSADLQTLHDYTLTEGFLKKWEAMMVDPNKPTCNLMILNLQGNSLDQQISKYDARPGNHAYLAKQGLTSREMVLGTLTMAVAGMQEMLKNAPDMAKRNGGMQVSAKNMAFHQSHKGEIMKVMQSASQARGGKIPNCAK
jgi:prolyl oligopeptidase PreP (S9A serine peptidase family)